MKWSISITPFYANMKEKPKVWKPELKKQRNTTEAKWSGRWERKERHEKGGSGKRLGGRKTHMWARCSRPKVLGKALLFWDKWTTSAAQRCAEDCLLFSSFSRTDDLSLWLQAHFQITEESSGQQRRRHSVRFFNSASLGWTDKEQIWISVHISWNLVQFWVLKHL